MSLRKIAKELGITPAYLSMMVNGKRPWREDLYERYCQLVNTVNSNREYVNKNLSVGAVPDRHAHPIIQMAGARGSRTHRPDRRAGTNGVEVRETHQGPSAPTMRATGNYNTNESVSKMPSEVAGEARVRPDVTG